MKKTFILLIVLAGAVFPAHSQINWGVEAGGVYNEMLSSNLDASPRFSYRVGAFVNYWGIWSSGISYLRKSEELSGFLPQYAGYIQKMDLSLNYIELVPFSLKFKKSDVCKDFSITPVLSLYALYGFSGKGTVTGLDGNGGTFNKSISDVFTDSRFEEAGSSYDFEGLKAFDLGGKVGLDFMYKEKYILRLNYSVSTMNISSYDKRMRNSSLSLSLCYLLR
jgi:hypothetical protein